MILLNTVWIHYMVNNRRLEYDDVIIYRFRHIQPLMVPLLVFEGILCVDLCVCAESNRQRAVGYKILKSPNMRIITKCRSLIPSMCWHRYCHRVRLYVIDPHWLEVWMDRVHRIGHFHLIENHMWCRALLCRRIWHEVIPLASTNESESNVTKNVTSEKCNVHMIVSEKEWIAAKEILKFWCWHLQQMLRLCIWCQ